MWLLWAFRCATSLECDLVESLCTSEISTDVAIEIKPDLGPVPYSFCSFSGDCVDKEVEQDRLQPSIEPTYPMALTENFIWVPFTMVPKFHSKGLYLNKM